MHRVISLIVTGILLAGVLWDPYTYAYNGSDAVLPTPLWQTAFAIFDISVLFALVALCIRGKLRGGAVLAIIETGYYLAGNTVLYVRDGSARFVHGFGAESNLAEHVVVLVLRVLLIVYLTVVSLKRVGRESAQRAA